MVGNPFWQLAFYLGHNEIDELLLTKLRRPVELLATIWAISFLTAPRETCRRSVTQIRFDRLWIVPKQIKIRGISRLRESLDTMARRWVGWRK